MIPIAAPWRTADIVMLIIKIGNSKTKKLNGLGCLLAKKCIPIKKIIPNGYIDVGIMLDHYQKLNQKSYVQVDLCSQQSLTSLDFHIL